MDRCRRKKTSIRLYKDVLEKNLHKCQEESILSQDEIVADKVIAEFVTSLSSYSSTELCKNLYLKRVVDLFIIDFLKPAAMLFHENKKLNCVCPIYSKSQMRLKDFLVIRAEPSEKEVTKTTSKLKALFMGFVESHSSSNFDKENFFKRVLSQCKGYLKIRASLCLYELLGENCTIITYPVYELLKDKRQDKKKLH